ncbi:MAG TPA: tyrosine-type recombinase/integrase [Verrucomicrobiae bacterium]|jgi:integrase
MKLIFPLEVKRGNATVKIYRREKNGYEEFRLAYYVADGQRKLQSFSSLQAAKDEAASKAASLSTGDVTALSLSGDERLSYVRAIETLRPINVRVEMAATEYAKYWHQMGGDFFKEAVSQFLIRRNTVKPALVPELVKLFIEQKTSSTKRSRPASPDYLKDLQARLGRFADQFPGPIADITPDNVVAFLDGLKMSARTRFNYARLVRTLFHFAQSRRFLAKDVDPMEGVDIDFEDDGEIEIFTVAELDRILKTARPELVSFIAIGAFAGLRHAEIKRLDWQEIDLERGFIEVKGAKAKTRQRRLVPISENLKAWLTPHHLKSGPVIRFVHSSKQLMWLMDDVNRDASTPPFHWKRNGLRHSFISYRVAEIQSADKVALEAGNSPQMIFKHYRELVRPEDARAWFSLMPENNQTVASMSAAA